MSKATHWLVKLTNDCEFYSALTYKWEAEMTAKEAFPKEEIISTTERK